MRLLYPSTIPRKYGVASEVAKTEFLRIPGVPLPKAFDRNSSASNEIGPEYIIMERVQGRELADTWYTITCSIILWLPICQFFDLIDEKIFSTLLVHQAERQADSASSALSSGRSQRFHQRII